MRVLHIIHQYLPEHVGGTELYTQSMMHALAARGHTVALFTRRDQPGVGWDTANDGSVQLYNGWTGVLTPAQRYQATLHNPPLLRTFAAVVADFQPELVHIQHLLGLPIGILSWLQAHRLPYLVSLYDYWWVCANANRLTNYADTLCNGPQGHLNCTRCAVARAGGKQAWLLAPVLWATLRWRAHKLQKGLQGARAVIAPSTFVGEWHLRHGLPTERLHVVPMDVETAPAHLPRRQRQPSEPLRLLYMGGIARIKGVHVAIHAVTHTVHAENVELWIGGNEAADPAYTAILRQQATSQVRFLGPLTRPAVWQTLSQVDAVLVPSLTHESFCLVAREALAAGVPVLASRIGALPEVVQDGENGLLLPPGNVAAWQAAIQRLATEPGLLAHLQAGGKAANAPVSHVAQIEQIYTQALNHSE